MKITSIELNNFRCFENFKIDFSKDYNIHVIIAENMVGKSALMAALRLAANTYTSGLQTEQQIKITDHRIIGKNPFSDISTDVSITVDAIIQFNDSERSLLKWKKYKTKPRGAKTKLDIIGQTDPRNISKILNFEAATGKGIQPLFSFIGTEYIHVESSDTVNWQIEGKSIDGYKGCWEDKSIKKFLFKWLERIDSILNEIQRKKILAETYAELPQNAMYLLKKAVTSILPDINEIEWSVDSKQPVVKLKNGEIRQFDVLSDGYRYLILLAGELATRSFLLNKLAGKSILKQIYGLVIIDEFGIHLHPALQNEALNRLKNTFPNVQFIVSTHSPLLLNGLKKEQIHILTTDIEGNRIASNPDEDILGLGANDILTKIFGLSTTMDNEFITMNEEYTALFKKKSENIELEASEIERFNILTKALSHLRLDPTLQITTEDPITTIVKEELANRSALESFTKNEPNPDSLKNKVDDILNNLFPNT